MKQKIMTILKKLPWKHLFNFFCVIIIILEIIWIAEKFIQNGETLPENQDVDFSKEDEYYQIDSISGDFDGDGVLEYAWLIPPKISKDGMNCEGECISYIRFSNPNIPEIEVENCIGGTPFNLGDLNNNKTDELGLTPHWFTSCWRPYYVWTLKNNCWVYAVEPIPVHCDLWESGEFPIKMDPHKKGNVIITYSDYDDGIIVKTKSVRIKK